MAKRIIGTTPKQDGYRMPAEFEPQQGVWMLWPERNDNWRDGGKPAQKAFADVAKAIAKFEKVTVGASVRQYQNARAKLPENIRVVELESDDAWVRDCGPTFLVNDKGGLRAVDWEFNAWGRARRRAVFPLGQGRPDRAQDLRDRGRGQLPHRGFRARGRFHSRRRRGHGADD